MERTLVIIKPDAIQRGISGEIISRFEKVGLKMIGLKMFIPTKDLLNKHYPVDRDDFIVGMAQKTIDNCKEQGISVKKIFNTDDPKKIGLQLQKWLVDFMTYSPVVALVLEGPHAIEVVRKIRGDTLPVKAMPGTITGDYSFDSSSLGNEQGRPIKNLVHASGNKEEAGFEVDLWFDNSELHSDYETVHQSYMHK